MSSEHAVELRAPAGVMGVTVSFTDSSVEAVSLATGSLADRASVERCGNGTLLVLDWAPPLEGERPIELVVRAGPTPPPAPAPLWHTSKWARVFSVRQQWARGSDERAYFFELDRLTYGPLLEFSPDIPPAEREPRKILCDRLAQECLLPRLQQRLYGNTVFDLPAPTGAAAHFSQIFGECAARTLGGDLDRAKLAMEQFARGALRLEFKVPGQVAPEVHSEPDSYYIFLFAELALLCIEEIIDVDMWQELLPTLVKMQSIFVSRFSSGMRGIWSITDYETPPAPPTDPASAEARRLKGAFRDIEARYKSINTKDRAVLLAEIQRNLKGADPTGRFS